MKIFKDNLRLLKLLIICSTGIISYNTFASTTDKINNLFFEKESKHLNKGNIVKKNNGEIYKNYTKKIAGINWSKVKKQYYKKDFYWEAANQEDYLLIENNFKKIIKDEVYQFNSLNRSIVFNNNNVGPDISWLVPPGLSWSKSHKFDASVRGHNRRNENDHFFGWNNGDAVGQFYYKFLNRKNSNLVLNLGMRSVYQGKTNQSNIGEGLSSGFRWDYQLSNDSGIAFGAEQLIHFDGLTDTGRDIYFSASKVFGIEDEQNPFPLFVVTGGVGTGKLAEGAIKGLCSDLFGGAGRSISVKERLCWAPIFSIAMVPNEKFSTFLEYNSHSFILGSSLSLSPSKKLPMRGTFAIKLADEDNYKINNFSEMTWIFRASLGF